MKPVYIVGHSILSPIGTGTKLNYESAKIGTTAIGLHPVTYADRQLPLALFPASATPLPGPGTRFEKLCIDCILDALSEITDFPIHSRDTLFLLSTTKGNIVGIENLSAEAPIPASTALFQSADFISKTLGIMSTPRVVSSACISGVLAISIATRLLQNGSYRHAVIVGADVLSKFIISGFLSLSAIGTGICRPYDLQRNGISLGECAAAMLLTTDPELITSPHPVQVAGSASSNDANHISGPSKTGEELCDAIKKAILYSDIKNDDLAFISSHGTATIYNDEMESKAFEKAGLSSIPLFSLKSIFGHTLGASGLVESVITIQALQEGVVLPNHNYETIGVSGDVQVNTICKTTSKKYALKTASGFGGCNAAIVFGLK
jgi:3-oxoacyl-[acyl-carrier-protein] synthase-1